MMGLPSEDEWPRESPIPREAFEDYSQPVITLERLVRFQDSCAFELLRVSLFDSFISYQSFIHYYSHSWHSNKVFVQQQCERWNIISSDE